MKKGWNIVGTILFWVVVVAYFVFASILRNEREEERRVERVEVIIEDSAAYSFITSGQVTDLINNEGLNPLGKSIDSVDLAAINRTVEEYCFTQHSLTYIDYEGTLTIKLTQRKPIVRIKTDKGYDFYLTKEGYVLPVEPHSAPNLPIVTGALEVPFGKSFEGDLAEWFSEGEKKYRENCNFLCKLTNFVVYLEESQWEEGKCVQINLVSPKSGNTKGGGFVEPRIELIPRVGDYLVEFGKLEQVDEKMYRWKRFVESQVIDMTGGTLNVEYEGQVVWKAPKQTKNTKKK